MSVGKRIYYDKITGEVLADTGSIFGTDYQTTVEQDFQIYLGLINRVPDSVGMMQLEYGEKEEDFGNCIGFRVNVENETLEFDYGEQPEPVFIKSLSDKVGDLETENVNLMLALTELYEQKEAEKDAMEQENINTMLALTELYEQMLTMQNGGTT